MHSTGDSDSEEVQRVTKLTQRLIRIPSQGGIDNPSTVCQALIAP